MSSLNGVTYICSAGLSSVTSAGSLGPYFALTYFLPIYDYRIDRNICGISALNISALNYTSATHGSLSGLEIVYNNPELFGQGSYNVSNFESIYSRELVGSGPLFTNSRQKTSDNKINTLNGKVIQSQVSATGFNYLGNGQLSANGVYELLATTAVNSWNPLSAASVNWNYRNLYRVTSYSPNQSTSGYASGNYKCRIPAATGSFKFNMLAVYATRVNQYGYPDPGVPGSPFNPTLFAVVCFDTPQIKSDTAGSLNAFEANIELTFQLASSAASPVYVSTDYFTRIPTSNTTSAYALNYDGDVVISSSADPGSWVPKAKFTVVDPEKNQVRLAHDDTRYTNITTKRFKPYPNYLESSEMAVLNIDTSCPDDALLELGYNCVATGIKSVAMGCYSSATGFENAGSPYDNFGDTNPTMYDLYTQERGGYTFTYGVENISQGLVSTSFGHGSSAIGYSSFAGGYKAIAASYDMSTTYFGGLSEGCNFTYGFKTSAITDIDTGFPGGWNASSLSTWFTGINGALAGANFATNIQTLARGDGNAAFNINTIAYGTGNASFGMNTSALGILTIATGLATKAEGNLSQAHGQYTSANAILSYVYGGLAIAETNAHGSFTFGSPYMYGTGGGSTVVKSPSYKTFAWNNTNEVPTTFSETSYTVDKYEKTYNDGMGTFIFGQGSSALTNALQSFVGGIKNIVGSQGSTVFGNYNAIETNSSYNFINGGFNKINSANYSNVLGFNNTLSGASDSSILAGTFNYVQTSNNSVVLGSSNTVKTSQYSVVIGKGLNLLNSSNSYNIGDLNTFITSPDMIVFGKYNNVTNSTNSSIFGSKNTVSNSDSSIAIGNKTIVTGNNSLALGLGASVNSNNTIMIGSCEVTSAVTVANNIVLDAKSCSTLSNKTKILLRADDIELDGYKGNIERYKFLLSVYRNRDDLNPSNGNLTIKLTQMRCDYFSGAMKQMIVIISNGQVGNHNTIIKKSGSSSYPITNNKVIAFVMINPITMDVFFGDMSDVGSIQSYIKNGYRMIADTTEMDTNNVIWNTDLNIHLFNDITSFNIRNDSNDNNQDARIWVFGNYKNYDEQKFTSTLDDFSAYVFIGEDDAHIYFYNKLNEFNGSISTTGDGVFQRWTKTAKCINGEFSISLTQSNLYASAPDTTKFTNPDTYLS